MPVVKFTLFFMDNKVFEFEFEFELFKRGHDGCLTQRQREFVSGRRTKDGERTSAN